MTSSLFDPAGKFVELVPVGFKTIDGTIRVRIPQGHANHKLLVFGNTQNVLDVVFISCSETDRAGG